MPPLTSPGQQWVSRLWNLQALRYLLMGGLSFLFDFGLLWLLHEALHIDLAVSTTIAFLASFAVTYTLQRQIAFRAADGITPSLLRYALLVGVNTVLTTGIVWLFATLGGPWELGKILAVIVTTVGNFFAYRYFVFMGPKGAARDV